MDGLLLDSERALYLHSGLMASKEVGYPIEEDFLKTLMGMAWDSYISTVKEHMGEDFPADEYLRILWKEVDRVLDEEIIPLRPGAREIMEYCKEKGIMTAIATSTPKLKAYQTIEKVGIGKYFDHIVCGDMVDKGKPEPDIFLKAIEHFPVEKDEAIILEDGHNGAQAAIRGGLRLIAVEDLAYLSDEDKEYSEILPKTLLEVIDYIEKENEGTASL